LNIIYNVPYMPEYNPIESVFSKVKCLIRKFTNNEHNLINNANKCFKKVTKQNLINFYCNSFSFKNR
jgi:transposase